MTATQVCDVFGNYGVLGGYLSANFISAGQYTAPSSATLKSLSINCTGSCQCILAVYAYNAGSPGALLADTGVVSCVAGWNTFPIPDTAITGGVNYFLAAITSNAGVGPQADQLYPLTNERYVSYPWATAAASGIGTHAGWSIDSAYYDMSASQCP